MNFKDRRVAKLIIAAQFASDHSKGIHVIPLEYNLSCVRGYAAKAFLITKAIELLNEYHSKVFNYFVTKGKDQNMQESILVYFDIKYRQSKLQVAFHLPISDSLTKLVGKGRPTRFKNGNSRDTVLHMVRILKSFT